MSVSIPIFHWGENRKKVRKARYQLKNSELELQKNDIQAKIAKEEINTKILTKEQILYWLNRIRELNLMNEDNSECVINTFINSVYVYDDKVVINFNCREDSETIPLALMESSSFLSEAGEPTRIIRTHSLLKMCSDFFFI